MADDTPLYNLKAVINETGLSPATLRAWERRYGLLKPQRTPGGHRLYSRKDIDLLKWLVEKRDEGLSISRAVELWNRQKENGVMVTQQISPPVLNSSTGENIMDGLRNQWLIACLSFDEQTANQVLDQAFSIAAAETICTEVLQKGLSQIGNGWYSGSIKVQQEHFASAIALRRLNALMTATAPPSRPGRILAACPPGEAHDFILLMISYLLRRRGWEVIYLGANVPLEDLDDTMRSVEPKLVISAAQTLINAASLRKMSDYVVSRNVSFAFGGGIFNRIPAVIQSISGYFLGTEVANAPQVVELILRDRPPMVSAQVVPPEYEHTIKRLRENELNIRDYVVSSPHAKGLDRAYLEIANANFTPLIVSALALGDITFMDQSVTWLNGLLGNYGLNEALARQYYSIYSMAIAHFLWEDGGMIQSWLKRQVFPEQ